MIPIAFFLVSIFGSHLAMSAPTSLDANTLLQNGQTAQQLNAEFKNLKVTDSCSTGDTACISGLTAQCLNGAWQTQKCPGGSRQCFALPSVKSNGTFIACTSEANALSLITATGAEGGLTSNTTSNGGGNSTTTSNGSGVVTVTVVLSPGSGTITLPPTTRTISPAEASGLLSNLGAGTGTFTSMSTPSSISSSSASSPQDDGGTSLSPSSSSGNPSPGVILLTHSPSSATASASATSSADSSYQY